MTDDEQRSAGERAMIADRNGQAYGFCGRSSSPTGEEAHQSRLTRCAGQDRRPRRRSLPTIAERRAL
jgi:hypothetical protein